MKNILIICDPDRKYCKRMDSFLRGALNIPFEIFGFTENDQLKEFTHKQDALLIISEKLFSKTAVTGYRNILVLDERQGVFSESEADFGALGDVNIRHICKYQSSEKVADSILSMCLEMPEFMPGGFSLATASHIKVIAFYTPARGIDQTRAAFELACKLSEHENTLYICNDSLCSIDGINSEDPCENIADLMYYAECDEERFSIYLERIRKKYRKLCYLPFRGSSVRDFTSREYMKLIELIRKVAGFENIVLDFSESFSGLTDVLSVCDKIVILSTKDLESRERVRQFTNELSEHENMDEDRIIHEDISEGRGNLYRNIRENRGGRQSDGT